VAESLDSVTASEWDALAGQDDPFIEHAFLHAVETPGPAGDALSCSRTDRGCQPTGSTGDGAPRRGARNVASLDFHGGEFA
jgi:Peptidogalycan biosysnthesis/recognition